MVMMTKEFILHLSLIENIGAATIQTIMTTQRSDAQASDLYLFSPEQWRTVFGLSEKAADLITVGLADTQVLEKELLLIEQNNIQWATLFDDEYPAILREIYCPPAVLYWQGTAIFNDGAKSLAIVGSRASNTYGHKVVTTLVPEMVNAGWTIVSGGARGIDTTAHETAHKAGGKTIVVVGSGLLVTYPPSNKNLFKTIAEQGGLIVSCFPLLMEALPGHFPARNRIIAGLSHGCLVVQAAQKSGALITAHYALEQGRDVFAVPGPIDDPLSAGCHKLIQNGAKLVASCADILSEYGQRVVMRDVQVTLHEAQKLVEKDIQHASIKSVRPEPVEGYRTVIDDSLTPNQQKIIQICARQSSLDDIIDATGFDMALLQAELFDLQIAGKIQQGFTGLWKVTHL